MTYGEEDGEEVGVLLYQHYAKRCSITRLGRVIHTYTDGPIFMSWMTWTDHFTWIITTYTFFSSLLSYVSSIYYTLNPIFNVFLMCIRHLAAKWITQIYKSIWRRPVGNFAFPSFFLYSRRRRRRQQCNYQVSGRNLFLSLRYN